MNKLFLRINGMGNAWPVLIGQNHPFYSGSNPYDLGNISFSLIKASNIPFTADNIEWEVLIDAGLSSVYQLLKNENRIPECIILSHAHQDHIGGLEWIVQSKYKMADRVKYPIYTSPLCFEQLLLYYPYLKNFVELKESHPGITLKIEEADNLEITFFPVYHSKLARGSSMIFIEINNKKIIYTGDLLCPLLREKDLNKLMNADYLIADSNNRFPYPKAGHWSYIYHPENQHFFNTWRKEVSVKEFINPHLSFSESNILPEYFKELTNENSPDIKLPFTIIELATCIKPKNLVLVHYSGYEDEKYYHEAILTRELFKYWANNIISTHVLPMVCNIPCAGDIYCLEENNHSDLIM